MHAELFRGIIGVVLNDEEGVREGSKVSGVKEGSEVIGQTPKSLRFSVGAGGEVSDGVADAAAVIGVGEGGEITGR